MIKVHYAPRGRAVCGSKDGFNTGWMFGVDCDACFRWHYGLNLMPARLGRGNG